MNRIVVEFSDDGTFTTVGGLPLQIPVHVVGRRRVARLVPVNPVKRAAFNVLRRIFGEAGRVSNWTRTWSGPWVSTILATGETFSHESRAKCVEWEIERLNR